MPPVIINGTPIPPGPVPTPATVVAQTAPLLSLEQFRQQLHYNPWHFWGFAGPLAPVTSACNSVVKEYAWQTQNAVGRNEIRQALVEAESRLRDHLLFSIAPHFVAEEIVDYPRFYDRKFQAVWPINSRGEWKPVCLREGYVNAVGVESLSQLGTVAVTYSDADGDGLNESFVITLATTVTDPSQIAVYFAAADRLNSEAAGDRWRIQPVTVTITGGVATIRGKAWILAKPILYEAYAAADLDPATAGNFVATLEIYQRVCDSTGQTVDTSQGKFIWETLPYPNWWGIAGFPAGSGATDAASQAYSLARVGIRDGKAGIVIPGESIFDTSTSRWNMTMPPWSAQFGRPPDRVLVRYQAGYPLAADGQIDRKFQTADARLAMAQLDNRISACDESNRELTRWQRDLSNIADKTEMYRVSTEDLECPWGTRRGAVDAWHQVKYLRQLRGVTNNG